MITPDDATAAQIAAANPQANTWVTANAGSGKTHVLTNRVAQLLLNGTQPARILCLTYTKAAAAEMQNRLFRRLGSWAMMSDSDLRLELEKMGETGNSLNQEKLHQARTLFAAALETPGGLKIQTIHAFCDAILRRFPLEAGIAPQFEVLEDRQAKQIRQEVLETLAEVDRQAVDGFAQYFMGMDTDDITAEIVKKRQGFDRAPEPTDFGISPDVTLQQLRDEILGPYRDKIIALLERLKEGSANDLKAAATLDSALNSNSYNMELKSLEQVFLFGKGATKNGPFTAKPSPATKKTLPETDPLYQYMADIALAVEKRRNARLALLSFERTRAMYNFAKPFLAAYDNRKIQNAYLDYDDLIQLTERLLTQSSMAQWVLYRLDGGLDHILVDEAQDTSPAQWAVIKKLAEEFTNIEGTSETPRTLFVVGDEKQSIYSFQGADPVVFGEMKEYFEDQFMQIQRPLQDKSLLHSFRSAPPILDLVDTVFTGPAGGAMQNRAEHKAFKTQKAGRVDLWPFIYPEDKPAKNPWYLPVDQAEPNDPKSQLAEHLATEIDRMLQSEQPIEVGDNTRAVQAGDILILVQKRGPLFRSILKALKNRNIPVAGADRINVGEELAVRDVLSLLKFTALADDDLSLAEAMRSPLLGISQGDLFRFAQGRKGTLWQSFRESLDHDVPLNLLKDIRANADYLRPYELIERILIKHKGRENLIARLGSEVEEGLDELLSQAMRYEQLEPPTLTGFLQWFETGKVEIKRDMDGDKNEVRLMTVHGAKGLEAPIVILPDTTKSNSPHHDQIILDKDLAIWKSDADEATDVLQAASEDRKQRETAERMRLLYVALTRAESWLIICGAGKRNNDPDDWYEYVSAALEGMDVTPTTFGALGAGISVTNSQWHEMSATGADYVPTTELPTPNWLNEQAIKLPRPSQPIAPSKLPGAKAMPDDQALDQDAAMERGSKLHLLLEHLPNYPAQDWDRLGKKLLDNTPDNDQIIAEVISLLSNPNLKHIFAKGTLAEVAITAKLPELDNRVITGFIDRLIISDTHITAVDFKSNAGVPQSVEQTPNGILAQQAAYLLTLRQIYPNHEVEIAILWTRTGTIMSIPHKIAINALNAPPHLDDSDAGS